MRSANVTGHRPNKLWGYNYNEAHWLKLKDMFKEMLVRLGITDAYSGMALGVDTVFAMAVLELKQEGYDIKLHASIPCNMQCSQWPETSQKIYYNLLSQADEIIGMSEENPTGYEKLQLFTIKNNLTGKDEYILLKSDAIAGVDFNTMPLSSNMMYLQVYKPYLMQNRNEHMVDNSEDCIAVWDGTSGGTGNCVKYAQRVGKNVIRIHPADVIV